MIIDTKPATPRIREMIRIQFFRNFGAQRSNTTNTKYESGTSKKPTAGKASFALATSSGQQN